MFLFPSIYDNAPIVIREAAALKTPSIVIEGTNSQEGIIDNYNGFTSLHDTKAFADKIYQIVLDRHNLQQVGINAQKTSSISWEKLLMK